MAKFEYDSEADYFKIDPKFLSAGLDAAEKKGHVSIRISALDFREDKLDVAVEELLRRPWIKRLVLDEGLQIGAADAKALERLGRLESLTTTAYTEFDFSHFKKLRELVLVKGSSLRGLEQATFLTDLYLARWKGAGLPKNAGAFTATDVRISAALKLESIDPLFSSSRLNKLMLQALPLLEVGKNINKLKSLTELHVEQTGWTDFSFLKLDALQDLFVSKVRSLHFIAQLPALKKLYLWDAVDGDMSPVLDHPSLREIYFSVQKKHYSHKEKVLQAHLKARHEGRR